MITRSWLLFLLLGLFFISIPLSQGSLTEEHHHKILDKIEGLFKDDIHQVTGRPLLLSRKWSPKSVFITKDSSFQNSNSPFADIIMTGLVAQHPVVDEGGYALIVCHEFGHHLGGTPQQTSKMNLWSSVEGQADYWAVNQCLRRFFQNEDNDAFLAKSEIPPALRIQCEKAYPEAKKDQDVCLRSLLAGINIGDYFNATSSLKNPVSFSTPEKEVAKTTKMTYGTNQCRLDTFMAGAVGGPRPRCWLAAPVLPTLEGLVDKTTPPQGPANISIQQQCH